MPAHRLLCICAILFVLATILAGCDDPDKPENPDPIFGGCYLSTWTGKWICPYPEQNP